MTRIAAIRAWSPDEIERFWSGAVYDVDALGLDVPASAAATGILWQEATAARDPIDRARWIAALAYQGEFAIRHVPALAAIARDDEQGWATFALVRLARDVPFASWPEPWTGVVRALQRLERAAERADGHPATHVAVDLASALDATDAATRRVAWTVVLTTDEARRAPLWHDAWDAPLERALVGDDVVVRRIARVLALRMEDGPRSARLDAWLADPDQRVEAASAAARLVMNIPDPRPVDRISRAFATQRGAWLDMLRSARGPERRAVLIAVAHSRGLPEFGQLIAEALRDPELTALALLLSSGGWAFTDGLREAALRVLSDAGSAVAGVYHAVSHTATDAEIRRRVIEIVTGPPTSLRESVDRELATRPAAAHAVAAAYARRIAADDDAARAVGPLLAASFDGLQLGDVSGLEAAIDRVWADGDSDERATVVAIRMQLALQADDERSMARALAAFDPDFDRARGPDPAFELAARIAARIGGPLLVESIGALIDSADTPLMTRADGARRMDDSRWRAQRSARIGWRRGALGY